MKVGLIRCKKKEENCPSFGCFEAMKEKKIAFNGIEEDIEVVGVSNCGGCPGDSVVKNAVKMIKMGHADTIVLSSCMTREKHDPCPNTEKYLPELEARLEKGVRLAEKMPPPHENAGAPSMGSPPSAVGPPPPFDADDDNLTADGPGQVKSLSSGLRIIPYSHFE